jgi:REP-associated tyrosine transposase
MSRPLRIEYPGAWYHVMNRGRRREEIFRTVKDYDVFIGVLNETVELLNLQVAAYCLMTNHYHLLLHTPEGNLSRCMRHINGVYTQRFNRTYKEDGQLFRGRYKAILVDDDNHLLEVLRYIHKNPMRAGIVQDLDDFLWSSHKGYVSRAKKWDWLYKDFLLEMFAEKSVAAQRAYTKFVSRPEPEEIEKFYAKKNLATTLGGEAFRERIKSRFSSLRFNKEIPESKTLSLDAARLRKHVCGVFKVKKDVLFTSRRGRENLARDVAIYLQRKHCRQTLVELGKDYGIPNYSTVSSACERVKARLLTDKKLLAMLTKIETKLPESQKNI